MALLVLAIHTAVVSHGLRGGALFSDWLTLILPLAISCALSLVLLSQSRKAEKARRAYAESERRFRLAVEGARCGIWEWDLEKDEVFLSDMTGVMLGWGGGGVTSGQEVLSRVSPEHRERLRQALSTAREFGAFDVSFRVPNRQHTGGPGRSAWIDARGQPRAVGRALRPGHRGGRRRHRRARAPGTRPAADSGCATPSPASPTPSSCGTRAAAADVPTTPSATSSTSVQYLKPGVRHRTSRMRRSRPSPARSRRPTAARACARPS